MRKITLLLLLFSSAYLHAQVANDECTNPVALPMVTEYCSNAAAFTNVDATPSAYGPSSCFATVGRDVWFSFTALATDITITVRGNTPQSPGGTLVRPQLTLYYGTCGGTLNEQECAASPPNGNIAELYKGGLFVGSQYLIRVQGANNLQGSFQICFNNYNPPAEPSSDCPTASILCDKSSFVVQSVSGAGTNDKELDDAACFSGGAVGNFETNSTWFVWTCSQSGSLEFTLTPLNATDDLDFVLYRLPNGIGNCTGKQVVRCMASGDFVFPSPCMGPTGLRAGDPDINEDPGCTDNGDDAWLSPFNMIQGESYALVVNNFTSTGNGFSIDFGGTGQFLGPEANFITDPLAVCPNIPVQVTDASTFSLGNITSWQWGFGPEAVPQIATGPGPHTIVFTTPGSHPVVLTLETNLGCKVTAINEVLVFPGVTVDTVIAAPDCNGATNGGIVLQNISQGTPPYLFSWEGGPFTSDNTFPGVGVGVYNVIVQDANNCLTELDIPVAERILTVEADVQNPLCFGDANGVISLNVTNGVPPLQFNWGSGFIPDNTQSGFAPGVYTIEGLDATLCRGTFVVTVGENPPVALEMDTTGISCFQANDGTATATASGGVGGFTYVWSQGGGTSTVTALAPGTYSVTVADANGCTLTGSIALSQPGELEVNVLDVLNLLCSGVPSGEIRLEAIGGVPGYSFSADGSIFGPSDTLSGLAAGNYTVYVMDENGCIDSTSATLTQPPLLQVQAVPADTTLDLGFTIRLNTTVLPPGRMVTYQWTPATGLTCFGVPADDCADPDLQATTDQVYLVTVTDADGCTAVDTVRVLVNKNRPVYIPNVFKPAGNYENSGFTLYGNPGMETIELLQIYDRWGSLIWEGQDLSPGDLNEGWDGTYKNKEVDGVFVFLARVKFIDQVTLEYHGDVTVVR